MMTAIQEKLLALLIDRCYIDGDITLSSGQHSDYYIDGKMAEVFSEGAFLIGEALYEVTKDLDFNAIGGLAVGAVPVVTSTVISYHHHNRVLEGFWVREERKSHGTQKLIEGQLPDHARVIVVDDVVTSGKSVMKAIETLVAKHVEIVRIIAIVDRLQGARRLFERYGYCYDPIFTSKDLLEDTSLHARDLTSGQSGGTSCCLTQSSR